MSAEHFRRRAAEARALSRTGEDAHLSALLLELADDLDAEAAAIDAEGSGAGMAHSFANLRVDRASPRQNDGGPGRADTARDPLAMIEPGRPLAAGSAADPAADHIVLWQPAQQADEGLCPVGE